MTAALLQRIFSAEWEKIKKRPAMDFMNDINFDTIESSIQSYAKNALAIESRLDKTINDYYHKEINGQQTSYYLK